MALFAPESSFLTLSSPTTLDGIEFWDVTNLPTYTPQQDDVLYTVKGADRIDNLANRFYGNPRLWWVIAYVNNIDLPPFGVSQGDVLRIPSVASVNDLILAR